jgi:GST-like protein
MRLLNVPHEVVELDYEKVVRREETPGLDRLLAANPLAQFPTLITPEGVVMTEMAAIILCK